MPQGSPVVRFCGFGQDKYAAKAQAELACKNGLQNDPVRQQFCSGYYTPCYEIELSQIGYCQ